MAGHSTTDGRGAWTVSACASSGWPSGLIAAISSATSRAARTAKSRSSADRFPSAWSRLARHIAGTMTAS